MQRHVSKLRAHPVNLLKDERGATAIEYGLIVAGIGIVILASVFAVGDELNSLFADVDTRLSDSFRCVEVGSNCKK